MNLIVLINDIIRLSILHNIMILDFKAISLFNLLILYKNLFFLLLLSRLNLIMKSNRSSSIKEILVLLINKALIHANCLLCRILNCVFLWSKFVLSISRLELMSTNFNRHLLCKNFRFCWKICHVLSSIHVKLLYST